MPTDCVDLERYVDSCMAKGMYSNECLVTDAFGTPCATFILLMRTVAVWHQNKWVYGGLGSLWIGQIVLWLQTFRWSKSVWSAQRHVCQVIGTAPNAIIVSVFTYSTSLIAHMSTILRIGCFA